MAEDTNVSNELMIRLQREIQATQGKHGETLSNLLDQNRRLERRMSDLDRRMADLERRMVDTRDDIEAMVKLELLGRIGIFETTFESRLAELEERLNKPPS